MLDVIMVTYNQHNYIKQAIESVLSQKTTFPFRLIISDDFSTDGTGKICQSYYEKYPQKIIYNSNEYNIGLVKNYDRAFKFSNSKYISILEGDDYWTDPLKLQKQFDILQSKRNVGLVHCNYQILEKDKLRLAYPKGSKQYQGQCYHQLFLRNAIGPLTVSFRRELFLKYVDFNYFIENEFSFIDYPIWLEIAAHSDLYYLPDPVAVYRINSGSISHPETFIKREKFSETGFKIKKYFYNKYPIEGISLEDIVSFNYYKLILAAIKFDEYEKAKYYSKFVKPKSFKQFIKIRIAKSILLIRLSKKFRLIKT